MQDLTQKDLDNNLYESTKDEVQPHMDKAIEMILKIEDNDADTLQCIRVMGAEFLKVRDGILGGNLKAWGRWVDSHSVLSNKYRNYVHETIQVSLLSDAMFAAIPLTVRSVKGICKWHDDAVNSIASDFVSNLRADENHNGFSIAWGYNKKLKDFEEDFQSFLLTRTNSDGLERHTIAQYHLNARSGNDFKMRQKMNKAILKATEVTSKEVVQKVADARTSSLLVAFTKQVSGMAIEEAGEYLSHVFLDRGDKWEELYNAAYQWTQASIEAEAGIEGGGRLKEEAVAAE